MIAALLLAYAAPSRPVAAVGHGFPRFSGYVVDEAGVIDAPERLRLAEKLNRLERRTRHQSRW